MPRTTPIASSTTSCCAPQRSATRPEHAPEPAPVGIPAAGCAPALVRIEGGTFQMGNHRDDGYPGDGETPVHPVRLDPFLIAPEAVTNTQFGEFVAASGHRTEADVFGWSFVFAGFLPNDF